MKQKLKFKITFSLLVLLICIINCNLVYSKGVLVQSVKTIGGISNDFGYSFTLDQQHNMYCLGTVNNDSIDFDLGPNVYKLKSGYADIFIAKYDSSSHLIWAKIIGGTGMDEARQITIDKNDGLLISGLFKNKVDFDPSSDTSFVTSKGDMDAFLLRLDTAGNFKWVKQFGGLGDQRINEFKLDTDGNIICVGEFVDEVDFDPGIGIHELLSNNYSFDIFVLKLDSSGHFKWVDQFGNFDNDLCGSVDIDSNDNILVGGEFRGIVDFNPDTFIVHNHYSVEFDAFVLKVNQNGEYIWSKSFGGSEQDFIKDVAIDSHGEILLGGYFGFDCDFDPDTSHVTLYSGGYEDGYLLKLNSQGEYQTVKQLRSDFGASVNQILFDTNGRFVLTGTTDGWTDFDSDTSTFVKYSYSNTNGTPFLWFIDSNLNLDTAILLGNNNPSYLFETYVDLNGDIYTCGSFEDNCDFDPNSTQLIKNTPTTIDNDSYFARYKRGENLINFVNEKNLLHSIEIYPNPSTDYIYVRHSSEKNISDILITDIMGKRIIHQEENFESIDIRNLVCGVYLIQVELDGEQYVGRFVRK